MSSNNTLALIRTVLKSTSAINIYKNNQDPQKRKKIIGGFVGYGILYLMLLIYFLLTTIGLGINGFVDAIPTLSAGSVFIIIFTFTFMKSNGYLFGFKEYDILMSLPVKTEAIIQSKFVYMYTKNLPWAISISFAGMIAYGIFAKPSFAAYLLWIALSIIFPIIPMVLASVLGVLIVAIGSRFKYKKLLQTILTFAFVLLAFSLRFIIDGVARDNDLDDIIEGISDGINEVEAVIWPAAWFKGAVVDFRISDILLLIGCSLLIFGIFYTLLAKYYKKINSRLESHAIKKGYNSKELKKKSIVDTIVYKELRKLFGSTNYVVNAGLGHLIAIIFTIGSLFVSPENIIEMILNGAPLSADMLAPAIPLILYFFLGMVATTCCSPSLEGKNYWIVQSLPITKKELYLGKMKFHFLFTAPIGVISTFIISIRFGASIAETIVYSLCIVCLIAFSTAFGMVCGLKYINFDWENEVEVIKQSSAVAVYMLPNMFVCMGLIIGVVVLGQFVSNIIVSLLLSLIATVLAFVCYKRVMKYAQNDFVEIRVKKKKGSKKAK